MSADLRQMIWDLFFFFFFSASLVLLQGFGTVTLLAEGGKGTEQMDWSSV